MTTFFHKVDMKGMFCFALFIIPESCKSLLKFTMELGCRMMDLKVS